MKTPKLYPLPPISDNTPPTTVMLETLKSCANMEHDFPGKPYGPSDIHGSFTGLYNRGFVDVYTVVGHRDSYCWRVTSAGFLYLLTKCKYEKL
jgi:hypothetical protein